MLYFLVFFTFATCIALTVAVEVTARRWEEEKNAATPAGPPAVSLAAPDTIPNAAIHGFPRGIYFHGGHTWASMEPCGEAKIGMDRFAREIIGTIDRLELPSCGVRVRQGQALFSAVQGGRKIDFVSPLDGVVCCINHDIDVNGEWRDRDLYGPGWVVAVDPADIPGNLASLRNAADASAWLDGETKAFREFAAVHVRRPRQAGVTLQDGGAPVTGLLETMDGEALELFSKKFLGG